VKRVCSKTKKNKQTNKQKKEAKKVKWPHKQSSSFFKSQKWPSNGSEARNVMCQQNKQSKQGEARNVMWQQNEQSAWGDCLNKFKQGQPNTLISTEVPTQVFQSHVLVPRRKKELGININMMIVEQNVKCPVTKHASSC
jgi:hypothetical protein